MNEYLEGLPLKVIGGSIGNIKIGIVVTSLKITVELSQLDILLGYTRKIPSTLQFHFFSFFPDA